MKKIEIVVLVFCLIVLYGRLISPTIHVSGDLPYAGPGIIQSGWGWPSSWSNLSGDGFGFSTVPILWGWVYNTVFAVGSFLQIPYSSLVIFLGIFPAVLLSAAGIIKILGNYGIRGWGKVAGTVFYTGNTYFLLLIDGGQISVALAYGMLPWAYLVFVEAVKSLNIRKLGFYILPVLFISVWDIRFIFVFFLLIFLHILFELVAGKNTLRLIANSVILFISIGAAVVLFHFYWLFPTAILSFAVLPAGINQAGQAERLSFATLSHALLFQQPHWSENVFGRISPLKAEFIFIPILAFAALVVKKSDKTIAFWVVVATGSIFLIKGTNPPFGQIYGFLYENIPGFAYFRDPTKFYFLLAIAYSVLIAFSVDKLSGFFNKSNRRLFVVLLFGYFLFLVRPVFLGEMTGFFSNAFNGSAFVQTLNYVSNQEQGKVLWIKRANPIWRGGTQHPVIDSASFYQKRPFMIGIKGNYDTLNFLREASFMGELFDVTGIGYIIYPPLDPRRDNVKPDNLVYFNVFLNQLKNLPWISGEKSIGSVSVLTARAKQNILFASANLFFVVGEDKSLYEQSTKSADLKLSNNSLVFADENAELIRRIDEFPEANILLNGKSDLDLKGAFLPLSSLSFPADDLKNDPNESGWWKRSSSDFLGWKNFLAEKYGIAYNDFDYGKGWAVAEDNKELTIYIGAKKDDVLMARVLESSRSGKLKFWQADRLIGEIGTKSDIAGLKWMLIGNLVSDGPVRITTEGDLNVVNVLADVDPWIWEDIEKKTVTLREQKRVFEFYSEKALTGKAKVTFTRLNQAKYLVFVEGLTHPQTLVFGQNYDNFWSLDGQHPLPVYSMLNGFRIDHNGEYILEYEPQRLINKGLFVSAAFWVLMAGYFAFYGYKKVKTKIH